MSAAVAQRNSPRVPRSSSRNHSPMDKKTKNVKAEDNPKDSSTSAKKDIKSSPRTESKALKSTNATDGADAKPVVSNDQTAQPLAPPPRPSQVNGQQDGDYFSASHNSTQYNLEPNLFEQSFGNDPETPGKAVLPSVASLASPALHAGSTSLGGGYNWPGSLRSGPLSPAMLSGPAGPGDYFDSNLRGSFPTPNESSLRTGLTPGGGGSMFPAPSPGTQAFLNSVAPSGGATPSTLEFHRTAVNAAAAQANGSQSNARAQTANMDSVNRAAGSNQQPFQHNDYEAANGLHLLAQAGNENQSNNQFAVPNQPAHVNQDHKRARNATTSIGSIGSGVGQDEMDVGSPENDSKANNRKSKRASTGKSKRKNDEAPAKQPAAKKGKTAAQKSAEMDMSMSMEPDSDDEKPEMQDHHADGRKMTDEEKRKNFLERNRVAALKCRQRKKQWLANLQAKVEIFSSENDALNSQVSSLRDEILNLKTILIAHKDCPISQSQPQTVSQFIPQDQSNFQNHPYGMMQQGQQVMNGGQRRFS